MSTQQQYTTTNMRFPSDLYMVLKMEALNKRVSFTALVHKKLSSTSKSKQKNANAIIKSFKKLAQKNAKYFSGKSLSDAVIEMR